VCVCVRCTAAKHSVFNSACAVAALSTGYCMHGCAMRLAKLLFDLVEAYGACLMHSRQLLWQLPVQAFHAYSALPH
jgi:hypothetical protein